MPSETSGLGSGSRGLTRIGSIEVNRIGTKKDGNLALANGINGVYIQDSPGNIVFSNLVSGNIFAGVRIHGAKARSNFVSNNTLGRSADGLNPLGNGGDGVYLDNAPDNTVRANLITNNRRYGVFVVGGATGSILDQNNIGVTFFGQPAGNTFDGIRCQLAEKTKITDNVIASNGSNGVCITNHGVVTQDTLWNNTINENGKNGVLISGGTQNSIRFNEIFRNGLLGIDLEPPGLTPNDATDGDTGPNNLQNFPVLKFAFEDTLAMTTTLIGFLKSTPKTTFNIDVFMNINCDASGNGEGEDYVDTFQLTTGMSGRAGFKQVFSGLLMDKLLTTTATDPIGNTSEFSNCVAIEDVSQAVIVNSTGDAGDVNPGDGMCDTGGTNSENETECTLRAAIQEINAQSGSQTVIFDIPGGAPYTISPATELPAVVGQAVVDATTQVEFAGTPVIEIDGSGAAGTDGLTLSGGGVVVRGFVINRFNGHGVVVGGSGAHVVELNYIGTDVAGSLDLGNKGHGVRVSADNNRIGGLEGSTANVIAFNDGDGVHVAAGRANSIPRNSIHANDRLGINLVGGNETAEGVTANDDGDGDGGPNDLQNFPALDRAIVNGDELEVEGALSGVADATYQIEVFGNSECDASGFGEGGTYLGSFDLTLTGGVLAFNATLPLDGKSTGAFITATATDGGSNTSEFSPCVAVEAAPLEVSLGVLQNPFLNQYLDIIMVASAEVDPRSVALTVGGENVPMTLADAAENLWKGDYELDGDVTLPIQVCATSLTGSVDCASTTVAALFASEGVPVDLRSVDGRLMVRVPGSDVTADGFVVIIPSTDSGSSPALVENGSQVLAEASTVASDVQVGYTVSASNLAERSAITVEFRFKDLALDPGTELSQLFIHHVGVGHLPSGVDLSGGVVRATAGRLGTYELRIGPDGSSRIADERFLQLDPNYPNPFNPSTTIQYELQTRQHVRLTIYNASGRRIARLIDEDVPAGIQRFLWNGKSDGGADVASGVYFVRLETMHSEATRKMVLIR
jgi:CSLREA domain-containing protein